MSKNIPHVRATSRTTSFFVVFLLLAASRIYVWRRDFLRESWSSSVPFGVVRWVYRLFRLETLQEGQEPEPVGLENVRGGLVYDDQEVLASVHD